MICISFWVKENISIISSLIFFRVKIIWHYDKQKLNIETWQSLKCEMNELRIPNHQKKIKHFWDVQNNLSNAGYLSFIPIPLPHNT